MLCIRPIIGCKTSKKDDTKENGVQDESGEKEPLSKEDKDRGDIFDDTQFKVNGMTASLGNIEHRILAVYDLLNNILRVRNDREVREILQREIEMEWRHMALILDRLFFVVYIVIIVGSLLLLFPRGY